MKKLKAIVIGAGPAGLGAALALANAGIEVDVFERQPVLGMERRGETIRFNKEMEALLGEGFFESQTIHKVNKRRYYSHSGYKYIDRTISEFNLIIDWPRFINEIADRVKRAGASIHSGIEIDEIIFDGRSAKGVIISGKEYLADAVFSCGGHTDPASAALGADRLGMEKPVSKMLISDYSGPEDSLEYHFHADGSRSAVGCIFPRGSSQAEVLIMGMSGSWHPDIDEFCDGHKAFSGRIKGSVLEYRVDTKIPMGSMMKDCMPRERLLMAGDAMGHVQARGGSGIRTSFLISYASGVAAANALKYGGWEKVSHLIDDSYHLRELKKHNLIYSKLRQIIFRPASSPGSMDILWPVLSAFLR